MSQRELDEKDFKILQWLDREGEVDAETIGEELGISTSTVYYRLDKFEEMGIYNGNIADIDPEKLGLEVTAITEVKSSYGPGYEEIGERLSEISGVKSVYFMLGEISFVVISKLRDHEHLQNLIDEIIHTEGVEHSATSVALKTFKNESRLLVNYNDEDLEALRTKSSSD
jgi:DNA-binding Lrp family transcriptional regulator